MPSLWVGLGINLFVVFVMWLAGALSPEPVKDSAGRFPVFFEIRALTFGAVQRARFHRPGQAPGLVELDEGEVRYLGPRGGGVLALDRMASLSISADRRFWLAESLDGGILAVPCTAQGSEVLFDAFSTLPGLDMERLLRLAAQPPGERAQTIWQRRALHLLT